MEIINEGERKTLDAGQVLDLFPPDEGALQQIYGHIRNGKSYAATADTLDDLNAGKICYNNWPVKWDGYDQRRKFFWRFLGLFGKREFVVFPKNNFHYVDTSDMENVVVDGTPTHKNFYEWLKNLTSCVLRLDEGHIYYDSYMALKMKLSDRVAILDTGHYDRTIVIISQRPTAIHAVLRGNVSQFFKVEKVWEFWKWKEFRRTEFQDTDASERPNEEREIVVDPETGEKTYGKYLFAISELTYFLTKRVASAYDHKFRRGGVPESQMNAVQIWILNWEQAKENFFSFLIRAKRTPEKNLVKGDDVLSLDKNFFSEVKSK